MQRDSETLLCDAIEAGRLIAEFADKLSEESYLASSLHRSAIERQLFIIGEALAQVSRIDRELFDSIPYAPRIVSFRNLLAHGYAEVDDSRVWVIVEHDLPETLKNIETHPHTRG
ncbi:MAG: DUF86 domain-containing protein [Armatimonadota bacterium]|nr:DUF86 domain-containing protein [Armatimonadota bacterium]